MEDKLLGLTLEREESLSCKLLYLIGSNTSCADVD